MICQQNTICANNASSKLISSIKGTFIESSYVRKFTWVSTINLFCLNSTETKGISYNTYTIPTQSQQYKFILLCARLRPSVPFIHSYTTKQSSYNTPTQFYMKICNYSTLRLLPWVSCWQVRFKPHGCVINTTCGQVFAIFYSNKYPYGIKQLKNTRLHKSICIAT